MSLLRPATDLWHVGVVNAPIASFLTRPLTDLRIDWLPVMRPFCFIADPFGISHNDKRYIFAEAYDYREKKGKIVFYEYSNHMGLLRQGDALVKPFHLSYPFLVEHGGEVYMLPEAHRSGKLTLYRARHLPDEWESVCDVLNIPAIDASVLTWEGKWWMFYGIAGKGRKPMRELHIAFADTLTGKWRFHPHNPVHVSDSSARMGGTPFISGNSLYLPTQDCSHTYGGAVSLLKIETLTENDFKCSISRKLAPTQAFAPYMDGFHTLSAFGDMTLIDAKRITHSALRHAINMQRRVKRLLKRK